MTKHPHTPDDPGARAVLQAYEDIVAAEGAHAAYDKVFVEEPYYVFYGTSPLAGRWEGKEGLKRWWDTLVGLVEVDVEPQTMLAGDGYAMYFMRVHFTNSRGEELDAVVSGTYETRDGKIASGRFWAFDQDAFDEYLLRTQAQAGQAGGSARESSSA